MNSSASRNFTFPDASPGQPPLHHSFSMPQGAADLQARRSISDSVLNRGLVTNYNNKNTIYMMVNRSGGATVRQIIAEIESRCTQQVNGSPDGMSQVQVVQPPESEICILAQWASDNYYSIVIAARQGIPAIIRAMQTFPADRGLQECCCLALGNLCNASPGNLLSVESAGGVHQIIAAMRNHPSSVAVQSAACDALRNMSGLIMANAQSGILSDQPELIQVLSHCKDMYLRPVHKSIAETLLQSLLNVPEQQ